MEANASKWINANPRQLLLLQWVEQFVHSNRPLPRVPQWLDLLPLEVNLRIAQRLIQDCSSYRHTRYMPMELADTSERQREIVKQAMDYVVDMEGDEYFAIRSAGLLRFDVRGVSCRNWKGPHEIMMMLLVASSLQWASVRDSVEVLQGIGEVTKLSLWCESDGIMATKKPFVRLPSVRELKVRGGLVWVVSQRIMECFPNLVRLDLVVVCDCEDVSVLEGLNKLKVLRTNLTVGAKHVAFLKQLDEVQIVNRMGDDFTCGLKQALTNNAITALASASVFRECWQGVSLDGFGCLAFCVRLKRLEIPICAGDETLIPVLPLLRQMIVKWKVDDDARHEIARSFLCNLVQTSRSLIHLELCNATMPLSHVLLLLQNLSLVSFAISICLPSTQQVWYMEQMMQMVREHLPNIRNLSFSAVRFQDEPEPSQRQLEHWRRGLQKMVDVLQRTTNLNNAVSLKRRFRKWCTTGIFHRYSHELGDLKKGLWPIG